MIQDSSASPSSFSQDSLFLMKKGGFPFVETPVTVTHSDSQATDVRKKFIDSQIKTKIVEQVKKNKSSQSLDGSLVKKSGQKDTSLFSIPIEDSTAVFRFKDIVVRPAEKKETNTAQTNTVHKSFFTGHELKPLHGESMALNRDNSVWPFFVLFFMVVAFAWIRVFYTRTIRQIFQALMNMTVANQMVRDENLLLQRASVFLTVLFNLVAAFFIYQASILFEWSSDYIGSGFGRFLLFALVVSFAYSFKFIFLKVTAFVFKTDKPVSGYIFNIFLINNVLGMILLPAVIGITFLPASLSRYLVLVSLGIICIGFAYRLLRGLLIGISYSEFSKFYLLLYLCTLEIVPLLILVKLCVS